MNLNSSYFQHCSSIEIPTSSHWILLRRRYSELEAKVDSKEEEQFAQEEEGSDLNLEPWFF